jgi:hypothetical protein
MANDTTLDAFVKSYQARGVPDDLDAFVQNFRASKTSAPKPPLPPGYYDVDAQAAQAAKPPLPPGYYDVDAQPAQTAKPPLPKGYYDVDAATAAGSDDIDSFVRSYQSSPAASNPSTPTIGPRAPTIGERVRNVLTFGAPPGSALGNVSGKVLQPGDEQRDPELLEPWQAMTPTEQTQHPILTGVGQLVGGLTTPQNVMLAVGSGGLGSIPGAAGKILPRLVSGVFSAQMLKGAYDQYPEFKAAVDRGDYSEAKRIGTLILGSVAMGAAAGRHALKGSAAAPVEQNIPQMGSATATGEDTTAAPTTIGAGEQLHPELPETLQAQVSALQNGTNKAVYFPKGQASLNRRRMPTSQWSRVVNQAPVRGITQMTLHQSRFAHR